MCKGRITVIRRKTESHSEHLLGKIKGGNIIYPKPFPLSIFGCCFQDYSSQMMSSVELQLRRNEVVSGLGLTCTFCFIFFSLWRIGFLFELQITLRLLSQLNQSTESSWAHKLWFRTKPQVGMSRTPLLYRFYLGVCTDINVISRLVLYYSASTLPHAITLNKASIYCSSVQIKIQHFTSRVLGDQVGICVWTFI